MIDIAHSIPILSLMILSLPLSAALIWIYPDPHKARTIALATAIIDLALSCLLIIGFDNSQPGFQFVEHHLWIPTLNVQYLIGVDGISLFFLPLSTLLFIGVILSSWHRVNHMQRLFYSLLLLLESATLGIFTALDTVLFFLFWELSLVPLYFLVSLWGSGPHRRYAAVKYTLFMLVGGVPLLVAFVLLGLNHAAVTGAGLAFDLPTLLNTPLDTKLEMAIFFLLLAGFAVKTPIFPLHTWLPVITLEGPSSIAAFMTGLKLGAFGLIRFTIPLAPGAAQEFHWLLAGLGVAGMIYGALLAIAQTNLRRILAYSSISHVGLVIVGIASFNLQGIQGAVFQLLNFILIAGGSFLMVGYLEHRIGSTDFVNLGGAARSMPLLAAFFFLFGLASMGIPGTSGFPAELLILLSALQTHLGAGLAALIGLIIGATYILRLYQKTFFGPMTSVVIKDAMDLRHRELIVVTTFAAIILFLGFYPAAILDTILQSSQTWLIQIQHD